MLTTRHAHLDERFRRERQHGMTVTDVTRHAATSVVDEVHAAIGYNYRMTDIQAAIGRVQLERLPLILKQRNALASRYATLLLDIPVGLSPLVEGARSNWQSFMIALPQGCDRHTLMQAMLDDGISTRRGVHCAHREPAYRDEPMRVGVGGLARSEAAQDRSLVLPLFHGMTEAEQDRVIASLTGPSNIRHGRDS